MSEIRDDIKAIRDDVKEICNTFTSQFDIEYKSDKVNGTGRESFKIYQRERMGNKGCERIVWRNWGKDAFGIQEFSFGHAQDFDPEKSLLKKMRSIAYESGVKPDKIREVFGVELRDQLLKLHGVESSQLDNQSE